MAFGEALEGGFRDAGGPPRAPKGPETRGTREGHTKVVCRFGSVRRGGLGRFGGSAVRLGHIFQPAFELPCLAAIVGLPGGLFRGSDVEHGPQGERVTALVCLAPGQL
jgi:hypothetical protein